MTHGGGAKKKRRGAGNRGGRGMAGTGKRGDAKKPNIWKKKYFGKDGFKSRRCRSKSISIAYFEHRLDSLVKSGLVKAQEGFIVADLKDFGCKKLIGKGKITQKYKITCEEASAKVREKIQKSGGEVITPGEQE